MHRPIKPGTRVFFTLIALLWGAAKADPAPPPTEPAAFVNAAMQAGMLEVEAGKVAMNASTNSAVKTFSDKMVTDHGNANAELAVIAKKKGITVPVDLDVEHTRMLQSLRDKSSKDFDAAYVGHMVQDHHQAVALFQANASSKDIELAAFAARTLPVLQEHKRLAEDLQSSVKGGPKADANPPAVPAAGSTSSKQ